MKNYIGISRDHSGSMSHLAVPAAKDYNVNIDAIKKSATKKKQKTYISVVKSGVGRFGEVVEELRNVLVSKVPKMKESDYVTDGSSTPLFDSIGTLIETFEFEVEDENTSFLVMAITDGYENSSKRWTAQSLSKKIIDLQKTDKWTFVFRVPFGHKNALVRLGIPEGNILEWELTEKGAKEATIRTVSAFDGFYDRRALGETSTKSFYTDLSGVSKRTLKAKLVNVSDKVKFMKVPTTSDGIAIKDFVEARTKKPFVKGEAFYQLTKTEREVQDYKQLIIRDKKTKDVFIGTEARNILGLPHNGSARVVPGNHGAYDVFVQSTSTNRKLVGGTEIICLGN